MESPTPSPSFIDRLSERQATLAVLLLPLLLYVPFAGSYGLWDPWETHYGEVARQMAARNDFISLWWAGSPIDVETFWSKPVLTFWLLALSFKLMGVGGGAPGEFAVSTRVEWAMRLPFAIFATLAIFGVYLIASRFVSRRAGFLSALALATMPMFGLVARNAMTDMPFVGPMTLALALGAMALFDDRDDNELPRRRWKRLSWPDHPLFYLTIAAAVLIVLPQLVVNSLQLRWTPFRDRTRWIPGVLVMLPYILAFGAFIWATCTTRFRAPFYLYLAAMLCGLAVLAKGLAGLGLPVIVFLAYLLFTWNWRRLGRAGLGRGIIWAFVITAIVAVPWHHAMLVRHGFPFWDELYGDNHWRRLVTGRHGDRGSFEYFLRELGYGVLPWLALAPSALLWAVMRPIRLASAPDDSVLRPHKQHLFWFGAIWFVAAFAVVSLSMTKFHHYILPALPGLALCIGGFLDDVAKPGRKRIGFAAALVGLPLLGLAAHDLVASQQSAQHFIWLFSYDYVNAPEGRPWPHELNFRVAISVFAGLFALVALFFGSRQLAARAPWAMGIAAVAFSYFLLDVYIPRTANHWSQKPLIAAYYKNRRSPDERLVAWQMYWRGETFYTKNEIFEGPTEGRTVFLGDRNLETLKEWVGRQKGRRAFFIVEQARYSLLKDALPAPAQPTLKVVENRNNKFYLASADL